MKVIKPILCIMICFWHCSSKPNTPTVAPKEANFTDKTPGYIDFITVSNKVWAITKDSLLVTFDLTSNQRSMVRFNNPIKISAIANDRQGNIVIADTENRIGKYENGNWTFTNKFPSSIKAIFFTKQNDGYLLTDDGIVDAKHNKSYLPESSLNNQLKLPHAFRRRATSLLDNYGYIWLGYNHGEWGGDIYVFNTNENKFVAPILIDFEIDLSPIYSFTEAPDGIYFSGGLSHLHSTTGYIGQSVNLIARMRFRNKTDEWSKDSTNRKTHYVGPISYNKWDDHLYIYSQHGIYKQKPNDNLSNAENWTLVVKPELLWTYGQSNATGYAMNVRKIVSTGPGAFLFLTEQNGIGYFNGKTLSAF